MIRIVLVDDQPVFRSGTRTFLSVQPDMEVVGEAGNGAEAFDVVAALRPDVVLMDVQMPVLNGIAATKRIHAAYPEVHIVLFTTFFSDEVVEGLRAGALSYLLKDAEDEAILHAIRAASQGQSIHAPVTITPLKHD
jgi:DNA-binding NarL/FixJ family response regulator